MYVLSLDPSSQVIGWAVFQDRPELLLECGRLRSSCDDSVQRMDRLATELVTLSNDVGADLAVMEWSDGKTHGDIASKRRVSGLAVLGQAQGTYRSLLLSFGLKVHLVHDIEWTSGRPKKERAARVALEFALYRDFAGAKFRGDPGLDAADAVGLGAWWLRRRHLQSLLEPGR